MTPETINAIGELARVYGVPFVILAGFVFAILRRYLVPGAEVSALRSDVTRELEYREARRLEERDGRLRAEQALAENTEALARVTASFDKLTSAILRSLDQEER